VPSTFLALKVQLVVLVRAVRRRTGGRRRRRQKYVDAIEQNALSRQVSGLSGGGGTERNRRRVDGSST